MTLLAAAGDFPRVRGVALGALRNLAVNIVAGGAIEGAMLALVFPELGKLRSVAVETGVFALKRYLQGRMRVSVTVEAAGELEMRLPCRQVALRARRDRLRDFRRMADMAAHTRDAPVLSSRRGDVIHLVGMAPHAVFFFIVRRCLGGRNA